MCVFYAIFHRKLDLVPSPSICFVFIFPKVHVKQYRNLSCSWNCTIPHLYLIPCPTLVYLIAGCRMSGTLWSSFLLRSFLGFVWFGLVCLFSFLFVCLLISLQTCVLEKLHSTFLHRWVILFSSSVPESHCAPVCVLTSHTCNVLEILNQRFALGFCFSFSNANMSERTAMIFDLELTWLKFSHWTV